MDVIESGVGELFQKPDPYGFRDYVHAHKSQGMEDKLMTEQEAVARFVEDGNCIGTELYGTVRGPMSLVREVIRQGKKRLRLAGQGIYEIDLLLAAGLVEALDLTYVGWEVYGISHILRRAVESGNVRTTEWSNAAIAWRFKAASMGIPFIPCQSMMGTDTFKHSAAKIVLDPFTGMKTCLLPALTLDVGLIHVHRADRYGNCQIDGISGFAFEMARACKKLIVSAELIEDTAAFRTYPDRTIIPYYLVDAVVPAQFGSHPGEMCYFYWRDEGHLKTFLEESQDPVKVKAYLDKYVYGVKNHDEYIKLIGQAKLNELKAKIGRH